MFLSLTLWPGGGLHSLSAFSSSRLTSELSFKLIGGINII